MSTNVSVSYLDGALFIDSGIARALLHSLGERGLLAECNFLDYGLAEGEGTVEIKNPAWHGEGSGRQLDTLLTKILPRTSGTADLLVTWEEGDWFTGIRVEAGVVTKHEIEMALDAPVEIVSSNLEESDLEEEQAEEDEGEDDDTDDEEEEG